MSAWRSVRPASAEEAEPAAAFQLSASLRTRLLRRAEHLCRGRFDAEDLVQDVLAANVARSRLGAPLPDRSLEAWLFVSMKNLFVSRLRHARVSGRFEHDLPQEGPAVLPPAGAPKAPWETITEEELAEAMRYLSQKQRDVFAAITRGDRYAAIADRLGISPGAVSKRIFDARRLLRKRLLAILARRRFTVREGPPPGS